MGWDEIYLLVFGFSSLNYFSCNNNNNNNNIHSGELNRQQGK